uniref:Transmembrane protein n=1 Tax=Glycine max TaxID=3847 RepID=C6T1K1_SOYBN|nr:unknown [Glycine max]
MMGYLKKVVINMILLFMLLLSMNLVTARVPLWISEPLAHGRFLNADNPFGGNYHKRPPKP